jgi:hypothetical protein
METIDLAEVLARRSFWDLSDPELASSCRFIAEGHAGGGNRIVRAEALRLFMVWLEALSGKDRDGEERERRVALLLGLRKRTIQIMVNLTRKVRPATPEP